MEQTRLNKYLAECGICSRRDADKLIEAGSVTVNGRTAGIGTKVRDTDLVMVKGKEIRGRNKKVVLAYHKPIGVTCTERDPFAKKNIIEAVHYPIRVTYAGRLDKDSQGLILLTNDGILIRQMMKAANCHEKEYIVKVNKEITFDLLERLSQGVYLRELKETTRACTTEKIGKYTFRIILTQGLNRQIRRMCKELGLEVQSLKRIRVMNIELKNLLPGEYRQLTEEECKRLYQMAGIL